MPRPGRRLILLVLVAGVAAGVALLLKQRRAASAAAPTNPLVVLKAYETEQAQLHWAPELDAQKYGQFADRLWNQLNSSSNKLELLWKLKFDLHLPQAAPTKRTISHEISLSAASGGSWDAVVQQAQMEGWQLQECEIRHIQFSPTPAAKSAFYIAAHLLRSNPEERVLLEGEIKVVWSGTSESPQIASIDASEVQVRSRSGPLPFREILREEVKPAHGSYFIDPLIVWDLDQDGSSEIILATRNLVFARASDGQWAQRSLLPEAPPLLFTGMLGDFTQDGLTDFVGVTFDGFLLWPGTASGHFAAEARFAWAAEPRLRYAQTLTAGDIDADGDLDLFLGQYKVPFDNGQMPHPYFDAKDGHPSFLLLNDGQGNFTDVTSARGLGPKQRRRAYSSSFIDLDSDNDLDLIVVSDFYGIDAYANDGKGNFTDITALTFADPHALGMGHSFADFNADGLLDILMIGMNSPTADRLKHLQLTRPYELRDAGKREALTFGNRLFFGHRHSGYQQSPLGAQLARTGWSWGSAAADFDFDGFADVYIANGHETKASVEDYEPEFWLHDIYVGKSQENALAHQYFQEKFRATRGRGHSYGGYERNRFFLNEGGTNFVEVGYLFGLAMQEDSRNVAAADLTGDGKLDLIVTTFEVHPKIRQTIRIFENRLADVGAAVTLRLNSSKHWGQVGRLQNTATIQAFALPLGEGYRTQMEPVTRIGLGTNREIPIHLQIGGLTTNISPHGHKPVTIP